MTADRIQQAMEAGEKNLRTWKLVQNWCANVKIVKHGGTGIVEMQTGLPIGHHFLECPHAHPWASAPAYLVRDNIRSR
jgi:hypothetical protein